MIASGAIGNNADGMNSGQVRVYSYSPISNMWNQVGSNINGEAANDNFGYSVDMSADGKTIVIGGPLNSNINRVRSGHARVYSINATSSNWTQVGADIDGKLVGDQFGNSVAMSADGRIVAIGAPYNDNANGVNAGQVRVFSNNATSRNWAQVGSDLNGKAVGVNLGHSVAISSDGKTIAVGAPYLNNINSSVAGSALVYTINGTSGNWTQYGQDINGVTVKDLFGYSVAMSTDGKTIAIGTPSYDNANGTNFGQVRIFSMNSTPGNWTQVGLDITGEAVHDGSGFSVALSNDGFTLGIGALYNNNRNGIFAGHVRVYKYELPPTKSPTKVPTRRPTKAPTKFPTRRPTKAPSKSPTTYPTRQPTKTPSKSPSKNPIKGPSKSPTNPTKTSSKSPTKRPTSLPTKIPSTKPTKNPTKAPSQITLPVPITVPMHVPLPAPVSVPTNCGLFGLNFFCPRRGECGFWRRLLNLHGC